jgi:hypothetical protein
MFGFRFLISYPTENNYSNLVSKFDNVSSQLKAFNSGYRHDNKSMDALQDPKKQHKELSFEVLMRNFKETKLLRDSGL